MRSWNPGRKGLSRRVFIHLPLGLALFSSGIAAAQTSAPPPGNSEPHPIIELPARPALRMRGQSIWDEGYATIRGAITRLREEAAKASLPPSGDPKVHFIDSDDIGFTFEAYLPIAGAGEASLPAGIERAETPAGKAITFTHEGAYDELDAAYEAITAYLDEKGLAATGKFLEEYLVVPERPDDAALKLNIFVFIR